MLTISRSGKSRGLADYRLPRRPLAFETLEERRLLTTFDVLVFSKTAGFRHSSISDGLAAIEALGAANDFGVTATEDASSFTGTNLSNFDAVVFLNTTGDVLNNAQQLAFEQYIQSGGGYVGIHAAADTEYGWPWYGDLAGAYFQSHPAIQSATVVVSDKAHPSTKDLPDSWTRTDEWYNFASNPRGDVHVLAALDESTYSGGSQGIDHPISWCHEFDGGRAWYTGMGHTSATYSDDLFRDHLLGGIEFAAGHVFGDCGATLESSFQRTVLDGGTNNPMELQVLPNGDVLYIERGGAIKRYQPDDDVTSVVGQLAVTSILEDGLLGLAVDPDFAENHWIYLFYSPPLGQPRQHLSRFELTNGQLNMASEQVLLEIPVQRGQCCHSAGSLAFGPDGALYVSTGDNTNPFESDGYAPIDERPGRSAWDAQKSSSNGDDLRGKILRIVPEDNGTYSIPANNLFPADGSAGRPEIYVMGTRNSFRISVDQATGWLYWGDVGPDAANNNGLRGPRGYDEINQARQAGNFGWPYFVADNLPYRDYDFETGQSGSAFNPAQPINDSPNNTGPTALPAAQSALIWYPYAPSSEFPQLGNGGRTAMAGPTYQFDLRIASSGKLPAYYDETLFIYDWSRDWIKEVKLTDNGQVLAIHDFLPSLNLRRPIDMELGPDGAIYVLEWGTSFGGGNSDSQLSRIEYTRETPSGDFDGDGDLDCDDVNLLSSAVASDSSNLVYDLDGDGEVLLADLNFWLTDVAATLPGDANLDGVVDVPDFNRWNGNKFTATDAFCAGDFNADGQVDVSDFNIWNSNKFQIALSPATLSLKHLPHSIAAQANGSVWDAEGPIDEIALPTSTTVNGSQTALAWTVWPGIWSDSHGLEEGLGRPMYRTRSNVGWLRSEPETSWTSPELKLPQLNALIDFIFAAS